VIAEGTPAEIRNSTNEEVRRFVEGKASPDELAAVRRNK
jgi:hypothetical protein